MSVNIGQSLRGGFSLTASRNGIVFVLLWAVIGGLSLLAYNSLFASLYAGLPMEPMLIGPTLDLSPTAAGIAAAVLYAVSMGIMAGMLRTFVDGERSTLRSRSFTRNIVWVLLNLLVGYVLFFIAIWIGFVLLIIPGVFLMVSLFFWFVFVVVEDQNFVTAFRNSWELARGNRWSLFGLGVIVTVGGWIMMGIPMAIAFALPAWGALALYGIAVSIYGIFSLATTASAYIQLRNSSPRTAT